MKITFDIEDAYDANVLMSVFALMSDGEEVWYSFNQRGLILLIERIANRAEFIDAGNELDQPEIERAARQLLEALKQKA